MVIPYLANYSEINELKESEFIYDTELQLNIFKHNKGKKEVVASFIKSSHNEKNTKLAGRKREFIEPTMQTAKLEPSDPDEFILGPTIKTLSLEPSDPDEYLLGPTSSTRSIEPSDPDEISLGPTTLTENTESGDPDELVLGPTTITKTGGEPSDPDEIFPY